MCALDALDHLMRKSSTERATDTMLVNINSEQQVMLTVPVAEGSVICVVSYSEKLISYRVFPAPPSRNMHKFKPTLA